MKLILCGGGSGEQNKISNQLLNEIIDNTKPILYIPLAMDEKEHPYDGCLEWIKQELSEVNIPYIEMVKTFDELSKKDLSNYSALFIGGGNTYKLLKGLKESKSFDKIKEYLENDGIVLGSSAGTVIFSNDIEVIKPMDPNEVNLTDTKGFNILNNISFFPHYINYKSRYNEEENKEMIEKYTKYLLEYSNKEQVIAIPEEDAIYIDDNNIEIIGTRNYYVFDKGTINEKEINQKDKEVKYMEKFKFEEPTIERKEEAIEFINEFIKYNSEPNGVGSLDKYIDNYEEWLEKLELYSNVIPNEKLVPSKTYFLIRVNDNKIVGMINIRLTLNENLRKMGGHIGYSIRPTERQKGYNKINLYLGLKICQEHEIKDAMLTCYKDNIASSKTMKALGGILIDEWNEETKDNKRMQKYLINVDDSLKKYKSIYENLIEKTSVKRNR